MTISAGERVPDITFPYVPYTPELDDLVSDANLSTSSTHRSDRLVCLWNWYVLPISLHNGSQRFPVATYDIAKEWAGKKVVVFAVPGAFTVRSRPIAPFAAQRP